MLITITDETFSGTITNELKIEISADTITVKELIEQRVVQEVNAYNQRVVAKFNGLVQPTDKEMQLNTASSKGIKPIDAEQQVYVALDAFQKNGFFVLIDHEQVDELERKVLLKPHSNVSFIKLVPLVGG